MIESYERIKQGKPTNAHRLPRYNETELETLVDDQKSIYKGRPDRMALIQFVERYPKAKEELVLERTDITVPAGRTTLLNQIESLWFQEDEVVRSDKSGEARARLYGFRGNIAIGKKSRNFHIIETKDRELLRLLVVSAPGNTNQLRMKMLDFWILQDRYRYFDRLADICKLDSQLIEILALEQSQLGVKARGRQVSAEQITTVSAEHINELRTHSDITEEINIETIVRQAIPESNLRKRNLTRILHSAAQTVKMFMLKINTLRRNIGKQRDLAMQLEPTGLSNN